MLGTRPTRAYKEEKIKKSHSVFLRNKKCLNSVTQFRTIFYDEQACITCCEEEDGKQTLGQNILFFSFPALFCTSNGNLAS